MNNPYDIQKNEAKHHTWAAAFNASTEDDNPYSDQTDPELHDVWIKGFRANKSRKNKGGKTSLPPIDKNASDLVFDASNTTLTTTIGYNTVESFSPNDLYWEKISTDQLEAELKKRKLLELQTLKAEQDMLESKLETLKLQILKLQVLFGE